MKKNLKLCLGWICFKIVMALPHRYWNDKSKVFMWILSWAGYYAF